MRIKILEHVKRSLTKALTFRIVVLVSDFVIVSAITHRYDIAIEVILASNFASTFLYYAHERVWNRIGWGKVKQNIS